MKYLEEDEDRWLFLNAVGEENVKIKEVRAATLSGTCHEWGVIPTPLR
jgi:hypothetical protein